jgi:exopolysaccharide biosynthesis polyprenyl glycosylphosphotransferase
MTRRSSAPLAAAFLVGDLGAVAAAWVGAYLVRFDAGLIPITRDVPDLKLYLYTLPLVLLLAGVAFRAVGLYQAHRLNRAREELGALARGVGLLALLVMASSFARQATYESRPVVAVFAVLVYGLAAASRRLAWFALGRLRAYGYNQSHALIVGTGRLARRTAAGLQAAAWTGIRPVAFVDDHPGPATALPVAGTIAELPALVEKLHIEDVFIALPLNRYADARRVFDVLSQSLVEVRLIADAPAMAGLSFTTSTLHGMPVVGLRENMQFGVNVAVKRVMDVALSTVALALLALPMAVIAALVKLTNKGPVFYRQERCSLNGRTFAMLKFRTMPVDAEAKTGPVWAQANDPRRTRLGVFLRATNLDELPQLFNVLRGEMSLVGPRPERPVFVSKFKRSVPNYMARHAVKAGLTGWAQVNGWRGNSSLRRRVQFDLYYIAHWNPLFDLRIIFLTAVRMLFRTQKNAY